MPKATKDKSTKPQRHNPLGEEIVDDEATRHLRKNPRAKTSRGVSFAEEHDEGVMPASMSKKVLELARDQKATEASADDLDRLLEVDDEGATGQVDEEDDDAEFCDVEVDEDGCVLGGQGSEEEERLMAMFLPGKGATPAGPTLADVILQKIAEKEAGVANSAARDQKEEGDGLSPKVIQVYGEIGKWMKHYKSGKLPKAFKVLPSLNNWEEVLSLTNPLGWSPAAMYEAVNIFASNLNPRMAQRFFNLVLLPAVRHDIAENRKLNFHLYRALRKSLFKPAAFFKGIFLPLAVESCTLREAQILASVLSKASIPVMHAAATIVRLCVMTPWYGTTSILMAALLNKKYSLPVRVVESLVAHFYCFSKEETALPLVWHKALLVFAQRYKFDLDDEQKRRMRDLLKVHFHEAVGTEVRRELLAPKPGEVGHEAVGMDMS